MAASVRFRHSFGKKQYHWISDAEIMLVDSQSGLLVPLYHTTEDADLGVKSWGKVSADSLEIVSEGETNLHYK